MEYSPVVALNRTFALSKVRGKEAAISEAEKLKLPENRFYFMLLGELYTDVDNKKAKENYLTAYTLSRTNAEKKLVQKNINNLAVPD